MEASTVSLSQPYPNPIPNPILHLTLSLGYALEASTVSAPRREAQLIGMSTCRSAYRGTTCAHSATSRRLMHTWLGLGLGLAVRVRASG